MHITKPIIIVGSGRCGSTLFHRLLAKHPQMMWLSPLCYKYPDKPRWNRMAVVAMDNPFLHRLFGEKILRDGRAVASSLLHVGFWKGWQGPQSWRAGLLSPEDQALWESYDRSFAALAGIEWRIQMRAMEAARRAIDPSLFHEVKYETFCDQPVESFRQVLEFVEMPWSVDFEREIRAASIKSTSNRWRDDLAPNQQAILDDLLAEDLRRYGYGEVEPSEALPEPAQRG
jgi:hypothetical protein